MIDWLKRLDTPQTIELDGRELPIVVNRNARAKRLTLRLSADGKEVRLTAPRWAPTGEALAFAHLRAAWLEQQLARIPEETPPRPGGSLTFRGRKLAINWKPTLPRKPELAEECISLGGPEETLTGRLQRWLEAEALSLMQEDLSHYCQKAHLEPPQLRLSRAKRRWGSCSTSGTVRINWRLIQAPDSVRRSVVAHEVAHMVHFDHSPEFHDLLGQLFEDDIRSADRWLKDNGRTLYATFG